MSGGKTLRKSTGNLTSQRPVSSMLSSSGNGTMDLKRIEAEYIKNLQQQVYFLELEANFLREQARKSTELQPQMTAEAKRMLVKLQELHSELDAARLDAKHKESTADMFKMERDKLSGKLKAAEDSHQREKRILLDEIVQLKKEKDLLDRSRANQDAQLVDNQHQMELTTAALRTAENKARMLESQLSQKGEQMKLVQNSLDEKRAELMSTEARLHETEDKYYSNIAMVNDKVRDDLRQEEIRLLKQRIKELESNSLQDKCLRNKMTDECSRFSRENSLLNHQILELKSQLDRNGLRSGFDNSDGRVNATESSTAFQTRNTAEEQLKTELTQTKEKLLRDQEKLASLEGMIKSQQLSDSTMRSKVAELTALHKNAEVNSMQLKRDKEILIEHVADLQKQLDDKHASTVSLQERIHALETKLKTLEPLQELHSSIQSHKWEEFSRLAESMKTLSRSVAQSNAMQSTQMSWNSKDIIDYT